MATRKGIHISGNYAAPYILHALFCMYFVFKKIERSDQIVSNILFKT